MERVAAHQRADQIEQAEQRTRGGDLAFLVTRSDLADRHPCVSREGRQHMQGGLPRRPVKGTPHRLAINRDNPGSIVARFHPGRDR